MEYAIGVLVALALFGYWAQRTVERAMRTAAVIGEGTVTHPSAGYIVASLATGAAVTLLLLLLL